MTPKERPRSTRQGLSRRRLVASIGAAVSSVGVFIGLNKADAFTSGFTDRLTDIGVAKDSQGVISIIGTSADTTPEFGNNLSSDLTVTLTAPNESSATFDVGGTGNPQSTVTFTLTPGASTIVEMSADTTQITVDIDATHANGSLSLQRAFEIPQSGQVNITPTVKSSGASGQFSFGLSNTGSIQAEVVGIRVDATTTDAVKVSDGNIFTVDSSEDTNVTARQLISTQLDIDDATQSDLPITAFDGGDSVILRPTGDETVFAFDRFRKANNAKGRPNADMRGQTVTVTVEYSDGSTGTYELSA